jgi:DNA-directed RNA polymerase specialized sigma24 family protein
MEGEPVSNSFFIALNDDWLCTASSGEAVEALSKWSIDDPTLGGFDDLAALVAHVQRPGFPEESDRVLAALVRLAGSDDLAARTMLQALLPGIKALARQYRWVGPAEDVTSSAVACAYERIRTYPIERRPHHVAANVLFDTRQALSRQGRRATTLDIAARGLRPFDDSRDEVPHESPCPGQELLELVGQALRDGRLDEADARLIILSRLEDKTMIELAAADGCDRQTMGRRRTRAETRLAEAVA